MDKGGQKALTSSYKVSLSPQDVRYRMTVTTVNTVLYIWKLLSKQIFFIKNFIEM